MTSIVAIRCRDGVVVGADSSATFGSRVQPTIEQPTTGKIETIGNRIIVATTGYLGHAQRFSAVVRRLYEQKVLKEENSDRDKSAIEIGKILSSAGIQDFVQTHLQKFDFSAFVAFPSNGEHFLCELPGEANFQPELRDSEGKGELWFSSAGSGRSITDPLLALFREVFWLDGPPNLRGGIFTALWAVHHACKVNPGGIKEPVQIAVLERKKGKFQTRMLDDDDVAEANNMVAEATRYMGGFKEVLEGKVEARDVPRPPPKTQS